MSSFFYSTLTIAVASTVLAILAVGFSRRWNDAAKKYLIDLFGPGPNDDELVEESRQENVTLWLVVATIAWFLVAALYRAS